jgi:signal transduction histidine kinase
VEAPGDEQSKTTLARIARSAERLTSMIDDLLDFSSSEAAG